MVKRVVWTLTAAKARKEILEYWFKRNGSKAYPRKLSLLFKQKINLIKSQHYLGKPTDFKNVRATLVEYYTIFYKVEENEILIVGIWDNRRNPDNLRSNLEI